MVKRVVMAGWDDVPHLSAEQKATMLAAIPPFQRDARSKGIPQLGAGAIYPVPESEYVVAPFRLPEHWARAYALDVGWNKTAALWGAHDRDVDCLYLYAEHYRGQAEPETHTSAVKARGEWIPGVIDPASRGRGQKDGEKLLAIYKGLGLNLTTADNAVEAGLYDVWLRLSTGRIKVFSTLTNFLTEIRLYRRDEKGAVVKQLDHLMDSLRYLVRSGMHRAITEPPPAMRAEATRAALVGDSRAGY